MPYRETYGNSEKSLAEAIADELILRGVGIDAIEVKKIVQRLDTLINLIASAIAPDGGFRVNLPTSKYVSQQNLLSATWIVRSPLRYPQTSIYVTQIGDTILPQPEEVEASAIFVDEYTVEIQFAEPCLGFVVVN